jgi:sugar transferase EpsL
MIKRGIDIIVAIVLLLVLSPLILVIVLLIRWNLGSPVLFRQIRPGLDGKPFTVFKFRSMRESFAADGQLLPDKDRITKLGRFLRRSSLDELPQLWCVLRGHMSLIGPRPLLMKYLLLYNPEQARRHLMRPGITGWAQVHGRNAVSWEEKFKLDTWYIDHWNLWLDLRIILLTVLVVCARRGIEKPGFATTEEFTGQQEQVGP